MADIVEIVPKNEYKQYQKIATEFVKQVNINDFQKVNILVNYLQELAIRNQAISPELTQAL